MEEVPGLPPLVLFADVEVVVGSPGAEDNLVAVERIPVGVVGTPAEVEGTPAEAEGTLVEAEGTLVEVVRNLVEVVGTLAEVGGNPVGAVDNLVRWDPF